MTSVPSPAERRLRSAPCFGSQGRQMLLGCAVGVRSLHEGDRNDARRKRSYLAIRQSVRGIARQGVSL